MNTYFLVMVLVVALVVLVVVEIFLISIMRKAAKSKNWPKVEGIVKSRYVTEDSPGDLYSGHRVNVEVEYLVNGTTYSCKNIYPDVFPAFKSAVAAENFMIEVQAGKAIQIHFNPEKPSQSVVLNQAHPYSMFLFVIVVAIVAVAIVVKLIK